MTPAVFLDRDGVINLDHGYVHQVDDFEYVEGVFEATKALKDAGYKLVVVTNQSGIARGMYSEEQFATLTEWMDWNFADKGVDLDGIYYCPHHAEKGLAEYKVDCECRKPKPGMLLTAAKFLKIDVNRSVMVGDKRDDMLAAAAAGVPIRILVRTGKSVTQEAMDSATVVLDSVADVPAYLTRLSSSTD
ncbi:D-glycero-beta-D-manno-heptose 1,7-bisphosphate 7-phosphatase [Shewanella gelidii]|uniref:D,D-heptose 1,7-bisphosphate phosphatase n=1 Tax=Shewanella gelidii TaxID=1642821 RepID=A0A917JSC4_9GAMM|nr:D-glycero-beta-D-manno-heptose 1,7-bisphosphate 7-phosphatase [Shewanella gelidii]MCL1098367.1 D-glycero-beta-D-manno-heptose 1,7-bisphosphate 7-phosphatase [Shewanella gelidii]GGI84651.1 D,D-heptose 1,7-bisphosphate phosphatase [Shewanella gelidii]